MRIAMFFLAAAMAGCSQHPTEADRELAAYVEQHVVLPKGSPGPECYVRYYRIVERAELAALLPALANSGKRVLSGRYFRPGPDKAPGITWVSSEAEVPKVYDAGCGAIDVYHVEGDPPDNIWASCSFDIGGERPEEIEPFSC